MKTKSQHRTSPREEQRELKASSAVRRPSSVVLICWIVAGALVATCVAIATILFFTVDTQAQIDLRKELFVAFIQLIIVGFIGATASALVQYFRDEREHRVETLREEREKEEAVRVRQYKVFDEIVSSYHQFKTVRRDLRMVGILTALESRSLESLNEVQISTLRKGMEVLSGVDLALERIDRSMRVNPMFPDSQGLL